MKELTPQSLRIGIVGLGLIGGSLAKALTNKRKNTTVCAVDVNQDSLDKAMHDGSISFSTTDIHELKTCDVLFICIPPGGIFAILEELSVFYKGIISDVSSVKGPVCNFVENKFPHMRFIPGHPMAGSERVGYDASVDHLFENAPYILCKTDPVNSDRNSMLDPDYEVISQIVRDIGARTLIMTPEQHDRAVGMISYLPHIVAYLLVDFVRTAGDDHLKEIAAGGFRDITRIASSDPALWTDIISESGEISAELIDCYIDLMKETASMLRNGDKSALLKRFKQANQFRTEMTKSPGKQEYSVQILVEVDDKPGNIGKIAVLLGDHNINIKNINIQDNREYEGGSMRITLSSMTDALRAGVLLDREQLIYRIIE